MGIRFKLILGTCLVAVLICVVGFYAATVARRALLRSIEDSSSKRAAEVLAEVNRDLETSIAGWCVYTDSLMVQQAARNSNRQFKALPDVEAYLTKEDDAWRNTPANQLSPLMKHLESNQLADDLRRRIDAIAQYQGHKVQGEVLITNRFGANIAQTSRTSDYQQSDEMWWQHAMNDGSYIGELGYDESSKIYSIDICVRINNPAGKSLGVIKSVQSIKSTIGLLQNWSDNLREEGTSVNGHEVFMLLNSTNKIIFSTRNPEIGLWSDITYPLPPDIASATTGTYTFERDDGQAGPILVSCAFSKGPLGFAIVVENRADRVLAPANRLRNTIITMALGIALVAVILSMMLLESISRRLGRLGSAAIELGKGNLQIRLQDNCKDEIGRVSRCFNNLAESLTRSRQDIDNYTAEIEAKNVALEKLNHMHEEEIRRLARAKEDLRRSQETLNNILNSMPVGVMVVARDKVIRQVNPAALNLMKLSSEDQVIGKICSESFCSANEDECPIVDLNKTMDVAEHILVTKDNTQVPILKTVIPLRLEDEDVLLETFVDISDLKRAEKQLQIKFNELEEANRRLEILVSGSTEREIHMVHLKQEVNDLLVRVGETPKYTAPANISQSGLQLTATPDD